ncbi:hypothetical protein [Riemerella anatipestifer]|uniref:hypothetical protein n=2 Tax=Riemerella anatipestifer TaxID=34085 RepID=UPI0021B10FF4|nr:hypothetical protein [Riemerella anatipestifer]MCT6764071.1 hypothetical protein [Riemerella anatipestifer]MCT6768250.1 hypothetical protein [Riemerella anatipestifer]MCU7592768.1 hypothetical protein [Riemerella anatipestifer]MCU7600963.1 hypothetical protein [Riemerella anatipestifer]MCU7609097.1 hypothetical protein [Riemerella anatipestifer]
MYRSLLFLLLLMSVCVKSQFFVGEVLVEDRSEVYLMPIYVTNLETRKTVLCDYKGAFKIAASKGDVVRFTSITTDRTDITITEKHLATYNNIVELKMAYNVIPEVKLSKFKPSGILKNDVIALDDKKSPLALKQMIGLPESKGDGTPPEAPPIAFVGGGLGGGVVISVDAIYDVISGDRKRKRRLYAYEKMMKTTAAIRNYYGDDYFVSMKIPKHMIDDFLQFVYSSEESVFALVQNNKYEGVKVYFEKYLPIFQKRMKNTTIMEVVK